MSIDPPKWHRQLRYRRGSSRRLRGLEVYYDFDWKGVFRHDRSAFRGGQSLSDLVLSDCPDGKRATLLLTEQDDVDATIKETDDRYIVVVPIHHYLRNAGADAATTYYARLSRTPVTQLPSLADVNFSPDELADFVGVHLTQPVLSAWAALSQERMDILEGIVGSSRGDSPEHAIDAIQRLSAMDGSVIDAMADYLSWFDGDVGARHLLRRLTDSTDGRVVATHALAERLVDRIEDTRKQLSDYQALIDSPGTTETDVQRFLETNPWIVGLPYVAARGRVEIPRGEIDFVLDRYDGFFDIVELKGPNDEIVTERGGTSTDRPPSASAYSLGPALAKALAQAHHYRSILEHSHGLREQYGLANSRQPRILILLGRSTDLTDPGREILRQLNLTLHRVEVIPYDLLGTRTNGFLDNIQSLLIESEGT